MNFYGTEAYKRYVQELDEQVFSKVIYTEPDRTKELGNGYHIVYYYYADEENCIPGYAPVDGEVCRLYKNGTMVYEWRNTDGHSRMANMIHHADGNDYLIFDEDLYGYSVLDLSSLACMHYIPAESHDEDPDRFEETFIWCDCFYNLETNQLAVNGCYWACPDNVIVLDFAKPMIAVEAQDWIDICKECGKMVSEMDEAEFLELEFAHWDGNTITCHADRCKSSRFSLDGGMEVVLV